MQLYRILIVDDEPYIVQCIATLIEEAALDPVEVFRAYSGDEALALMAMRKIDILITDVQMPGMSGIELAHISRARWPDLKTIVLTAHAEFEMARQAMAYGVMAYVLKTDNDAHILGEIQRAMRAIDEALGQAELLLKARASQQTADTRAHTQAFQALLKPDMDEEGRQRALSHLGLSETGLSLVALQVGGAPGRECPGRGASIQRYMGHYLKPHARAHAFGMASDFLVWVIAPLDNERARFRGCLGGVLETVQDACVQSLGLTVSALWTEAILTASELPAALAACKAYAQAECAQAGYIHMFNGAPLGERDLVSRTVHRLNQYIEAHVFEDLSLSTLADHVGYNASYLSRFYLEKTGHNISAYIAGRKLARVKALMRDSDRSLNEIALTAGFDTPSNFGRFIKRLTGMTPMAYRKTLGLADGVEESPSRG